MTAQPPSSDPSSAAPGQASAVPGQTPLAPLQAPSPPPGQPRPQAPIRSHSADRGQRGEPIVVGLDHVSKRFGDVVAAEDISLGVPQGGIVGIIGPSGAGKTTTIRLVTGSLAPDTGTVRVLGEDPRHFRRRTRERIGYMPQLFVLYPDLTARENVEFMASLYGMVPWRRGRRVAEVLELVDLTEARNRRASALSGGMQRRLELACALVNAPTLLILDEPTAGIDPLLRTQVWQEFDRLRQTGVTVIVTTQYVTEAEYCDAVALISEGSLIAYATPQDMRRQALGGEVIEVETGAPVDARSLPAVEGVLSVRQQGPRQLLFVVSDAGSATPQINDAIEQVGGTVDSSREYRPTFDEVFAALVTAHAERGQGLRRRPGRSPRQWPDRDEGPGRRPLQIRSPDHWPGAQGNDPGASSAGRVLQPRARPVPDHGGLRAGLYRCPSAAGDRDRRARRPAAPTRHRVLLEYRRCRAAHQGSRYRRHCGARGIGNQPDRPARDRTGRCWPARFRAGQQAEIQIYLNEIDPVASG